MRSVDWAAGLFEGEGCFVLRKNRYPGAAMTMTDEDVVRSFHETVGAGRVYGPFTYLNPKWKPYWKWTTTNVQDFLTVAERLGPLLADRRSARLAELMAVLRDRPVLPTTRPRDAYGHFIRKEVA